MEAAPNCPSKALQVRWRLDYLVLIGNGGEMCGCCVHCSINNTFLELIITYLLSLSLSSMLKFLAVLLASQSLPETLQFGFSLPLSLSGLTQTQGSTSSPSLYPLRSQLLCLLVPTNNEVTESQLSDAAVGYVVMITHQ